MAKNSIRDYSATNSDNTDIQSIDISEGCSPAGINNAIREVMADLKDVSTGAVALESPAFDSASLTGDLTFGDNDKAVFGAGSDLQIYHDGSHSYIKDAGTGQLRILATDLRINNTANDKSYITGTDGAEITLYHNGSGKLATTATGVNVTGTVTSDGLTVDGGLTNFPITVTSTDQYAGITFVDNTTTSSAVVAIYADGDELGLEAGNAERMRIDSSGNVGIGAAPSAWSVSGVIQSNRSSLSGGANATGGTLNYNAYYDGSWKYKDGLEASQYNQANGRHVWSYAGTGTANNVITWSEAMRITSGGDVAISTTSAAGFKMYIQSDSGQPALALRRNGGADGELVRFHNSAGTDVGSIDTTASATSYNTSSDYRLKENVTATWDATTRLKQLNPVRFNFIADADTTVDGFLAHEVQDIVPEAITGTKDAMRDEEYEVTPAVLDDDGNEVTPAVMGTRSVPDYQGIDQSKLVPLLVKTIQELEARIAALEAN